MSMSMSTTRRVARLRRLVRPGTTLRWLEAHDSAETGPEPPVVCVGPAVRVDEAGPVVESQWDGDLKVLPWAYVTLGGGGAYEADDFCGKLTGRSTRLPCALLRGHPGRCKQYDDTDPAMRRAHRSRRQRKEPR